MTKFKEIQLKAEMVSDILNSFSWQAECFPQKVASLNEIIDQKISEAKENGTEPDIDYYKRELDEAEAKLKIYNEIVRHLEKLF